MAKFTKQEKSLLKHVKESRLKTSLAAIREAAEDIWHSDAPRLIQGFTDHGIPHCERLATLALQLLQANAGRSLSSHEMYLLLAGIYLHDIGMQCDLTKLPQIKELAVEHGAHFEMEFSAPTAHEYTAAEQAELRKNHGYLSAAWIDYAWQASKDTQNAKTVLAKAVQTIPGELVDDLIDVCRFHTELPLANCSATFKFHENERKQLVTALLRLADELDINSKRVSIQTAKNFSLNPQNALYWWLHNLTIVDFPATNVVKITVRLRPIDFKKHSSLIHTEFVLRFHTKNSAILTILAKHQVVLNIHNDSGVIEDNRADQLPSTIIQIIETLQKRKDPLLELAEEIRMWLQAIRYEVDDPTESDARVAEMVATFEQGAMSQRVLVRCIGGEISAADVTSLNDTLSRKIPQGWLISDTRVSSAARQQVNGDDAVQVFSLSDFLRQKIWGPYMDALESMVQKNRIPDLYVDLACYRYETEKKDHEKRQKISSLDRYVDSWLKERGKVHISILGEFGSGKTWFCRHYAYRQLLRYLENPTTERLPLLITLRAFAKAMTPQQLINDALLEEYKLSFVGSAYEIFQEMNRRGKLLLILDGFDEMARQVDYQTVVDNFWQLASLVDESSKVILTSRTEYFRWAEESENILAGKEYGRRTIVLTPPRFEVVYLEPLDDGQIRQIIVRRLGKRTGNKTADRILQTPNVAEMARKPVLTELLLAALDEVGADALANPTQVYLYATNKLLLRNIDTQRTFTTTADKIFFLCELSWEMIREGQLRIHFKEIPDRIKTYFGEQIDGQHELDTWDFDLRSETLLHRDAAGYYEFAHKSLAEYFLAFKFAAELGCLSRIFRETYCEADGQQCELPFLKKDLTDLAKTFGLIPITDEQIRGLHDLLPNMMDEAANQRLWELIFQTKGKTREEAKFVGGNAATLLRIQGERFTGADLSKLILAGADLRGCDLSAANMYRCDLQDANLVGSLISKKMLKEAVWDKATVLVIALATRRKPKRTGKTPLDLTELSIDEANDLLFATCESFRVFWANTLAVAQAGHSDWLLVIEEACVGFEDPYQALGKVENETSKYWKIHYASIWEDDIAKIIRLFSGENSAIEMADFFKAVSSVSWGKRANQVMNVLRASTWTKYYPGFWGSGRPLSKV